MSHVAVSGRRARELGVAARTVTLCRCARLLTLVPEKVAKSGKLAAIATVLPALGLWSRV
jgi:hypothetical protein